MLRVLAFLLLFQEDPSRLVELLDSDAVEERDMASENLLALGPKALAALEKAAGQKGNTSAPARLLIERIEIRSTFPPRLLKTMPGIDSRLAGQSDAEWTRAFKEAKTLTGGERPSLRGIDLDPLAERAIRGEGSVDARWTLSRLAVALGCPSAAPEIARFLKDADPRRRLEALQNLGYFRARGCLPAVVTLLQDADVAVRRSAAIVAGSWGDKEVVPALMEVLQNEVDPMRRHDAATILVALEARTMVPELHRMLGLGGASAESAAEVLAALKDPSSADVARGLLKKTESKGPAIGLLAALSAREAVPDLVPLLNDTDGVTFRVVLHALVRLGGPEARTGVRAQLESRDPHRRSSAASARAEMRDVEAVPALLHAVEDKDEQVRHAAIEAIASLDAKDDLPQVLPLLASKEYALRAGVSRLLMRVRPVEAIPKIAPMLANPDPEIRKDVIRALWNIASKEAVPFLLKQLADSDPEALDLALLAIGDLGGPDVAEQVGKLLDDPRPPIRRQAAATLGRTGARSAAPALAARLKDEDASVRATVLHAMCDLDVGPAGPEVVVLLLDPSREVRDEARYVLQAIGGSEAIPALRELLTKQQVETRSSASSILGVLHAKEAVPDLLRLLADDSVDVRVAAMYALGHLGAREATTEVARSLDSRDPRVRSAAIWALGALRSAVHEPIVLKALRDKEKPIRISAIQSIRTLRPEGSVGALAELLKDTDETVRILAIQGLAELAGPEAVPLLLPLLGDAAEDGLEIVRRGRGLDGPADRSWVVRVLCRLGAPEGLKANRAGLDERGVASPFHLNALRQPELWDRLSKLPRREWKVQDGRAQLAALAKEAGLALEEVTDPWPTPGRSKPLRWHSCGTRQGSFLEQLEWAAEDAGVELILDPGRIRRFDRGLVALDEWRAWAK